MTWQQIREQYDGQWVLIDFKELDEDDLTVVDGEVIASAPSQEEIYRQLLQTKGERIAIEYAGVKPAGSLFITRATVFGPEGMRVVRLLVDTGSILAVEVLESIGCSPAASTDHIRIVTGSGFLIAARVKVDGFQCLGRKILDMPIVAHTLPMGSWINGLLGMDFLKSHGFRLLLDEGVIEAPR